MSELSELYQEVILDHNKNPRNFFKLEAANRSAEGDNPLCGDHYTVYLRLEGDRIHEISFQGAGCAISKASASMMTAQLKGRPTSQAHTLHDLFRKIVTGTSFTAEEKEELGKLAVFAGVSEFPMRVKCATLAWHTLKAALNGEIKPVTTE